MDTREKLLKRLTALLNSKYLLVLLITGIWMIFFDRLNLVSQMNVRQQIEELHRDKAHYERAIQQVDYEREQLLTQPEEMERYARERYYMKRKNEDVFVVVTQGAE
ncbi:MAG: septum formation initiator family protein [Bacteroidota bacterium]